MQEQRDFGNRYHLIDKKALEEKKLDKDELLKFFKESQLDQFGKQYNVVSVIGSQSTGKSTLLNKVFGTSFDVQDRTKQLGQTTIGIWVSRDKNANVLVLDVEGSDSVERKAGENMVENQTALLALAMSHAFIINVFMNSLGQHTSCQLSIIKIIMQMNLKLFQQDTVKHIIFVIRDWEEEANYDDAKNRLYQYLINIWNDIPKPENFANAQFDDLFKVQVFTLVYFKMKKEFDEETLELREKIVNPSTQTGFDYEKNIPMIDMSYYLSNIWDTIANNKDLNLPGEKTLISNMRCQQIKQDTIEILQKEIQQIEKAISEGLVDGYGQKAKALLEKGKDNYYKDAKDYQKNVVQEKLDELEGELMNKFYQLYQQQVENLKHFYLTKLQDDFVEIKRIQDVHELPVIIDGLREQMQQFDQSIKESIIREDIWQEQNQIKQFKNQQDHLIRQFIENRISTHKHQLDNIIKSECDKIISKQCVNLTKDFWPQIEQQFYAALNYRYDRYQEVMIDLKLSEEFQDVNLQQFENDSFESLDRVLQLYSQRFKEQLFQQFKQKFCRDVAGQPRNWQKLTEEEIFHIFTDAKNEQLQLLELLRTKKIKIIKRQDLKIAKKYRSSIQIGRPSKTKEIEEENEDILINETYYSQIKTQLLEDFDVQYQDAIQKHKQDFLQNIPKPFWFLLLFFMYDDVFRWLGNPLLLYPILLLICFVGFCIAIGLHSLPKIAFQHLVGTINGLIGPILFGGLSKLKSG
ncbi:hypothetical protein pb186bvf_016760 [Paramecium bursaria]